MAGDPVGLSNRDPVAGAAVAFEAAVVVVVELALVALVLVDVRSPGAVGGRWGVGAAEVLAFLWATAAVGLGFAGYRRYRRAAPDWIRIEKEGVVGIFGPHLVGRAKGEVVRIPFSSVSGVHDAHPGLGWRSGLGYVPGQVRMLGRRPDIVPLKGGDRSPRTRAAPWAQVQRLYLNRNNLSVVREEYLRWGSSSGPPAHGGGDPHPN